MAACTDEIYNLIDQVYKPAAEELGYELVFQERSEPKGSIHEEIWQYIEDCRLILCDLTDRRPNCFIEYGYALAKKKHIILSVEETEGKTDEGFMKVPFDTMSQKYSFWKREWLADPIDQDALISFKEEITQVHHSKYRTG